MNPPMTEAQFADQTGLQRQPQAPKKRGPKPRVYDRLPSMQKIKEVVGSQKSDEPKQPTTAAKSMSAEAAAKYRRAIQSGSFNRRLQARPIEGFQIRFVNDEMGRLSQFCDLGWDFVTNQEQGLGGNSSDAGDKYSIVVGTTSGGQELRAYLLKIPQEWYDQFKRIEAEQTSQVDQAIKRGLVNSKEGDGRYIPKVGIKVQSGRS